MSQLAKLRALGIRDWLTLLTAAVLLPLTAVSLKSSGVQRTQQLLGRLGALGAPGPLANDAMPAEAGRVARLVKIAGRKGVFQANCLTSSLLIAMLVSRKGIPCELKFGVRSGVDVFDAHAWVEVFGEPLADPGGTDPAINVLAR